MPKNIVNKHNALNINVLPPPVGEDKKIVFTYPTFLSKQLCRFVYIDMPNNDNKLTYRLTNGRIQ